MQCPESLSDRELESGGISDRTHGLRDPGTELDSLAQVVIDTVPSAMVLTRLDTGLCVEVSRGFCDLTGFHRDEVLGRTSLELGLWADPADRERLLEALRDSDSVEGFEARYRCKNGDVWRGAMSARVFDFRGVPHLATVTREIEEERRTEDLLQRMTRALQAISSCNRVVIHCTDETALLRDICGCITHDAGYPFAWAGLVDRQSGEVVPVASSSGGEDHDLAGADSIAAGFVSCGTPSEEAIQANRVAVCRDIATCQAPESWKQSALSRGYVAAISLPFHVDGDVVGALNIFSGELLAFMDEETQLLQELTDDLSFGLSSLRARARHEETVRLQRLGQRKYRGVLTESSEGIALANNSGIIVDWNRAMESMTGLGSKAALGERVDRIMEGLIASQSRSSAALPRAMRLFVERLSKRNRVGDMEMQMSPIEADLRLPSGELKTIHVSFFPVDTGEERLWGCICRDVTAERRAVQDARKAMNGAIQAIARLTEMRDPYTSGHQLRVESLSQRIAEDLGLSTESSEALRIAASLHDIGKIAVPAEILAKPTALKEHEWGLIKRHPEVGFEILAPIEFPWQIAKIVQQHHERLDGSGYPRGIRGESILMEARIIGVADVVEAMSSHRPYRPSLGLEAALAEVSEHRGARFDPCVVDACVRVLRADPEWHT